MSEDIEVGDRFEDACGETVVVKAVRPHMDMVEWEDGRDGSMMDVFRELHRGRWRRISSQPAKAGPPRVKVGQVWEEACGRQWLLERHEKGCWYTRDVATGYASTWGKLGFPHGGRLVTDTPSTGGAAKPCGHVGTKRMRKADGPTLCYQCGEATGERWVVDVKQDQYNHRKQDEFHAIMMEARDAAFHERQKAAILANWKEQQKAPYQPHWQRTGVSTYSRRAPK